MYAGELSNQTKIRDNIIMKRTNYDPQKHAFRFENQFKNEAKLFGLKSLKMETDGRCGGMAFASLDYYFSNKPVPKTTNPNSSLREYLLKRQIESFTIRDSWRFFRWTRKSNHSIVPKTLNYEIPKIKKSIDRGDPVVIGLVGATTLREIGDENHQVVCYGYNERENGFTELCIYDPNCPPEDNFSGELLLFPFSRKSPKSGTEIPGDSAEPIKTITAGLPAFKLKKSAAGKSDKVWRGFFLQHYSPDSNPPVIRDKSTNTSGRKVRDHRTERDHRENNDSPRTRDHRTKRRGRGRKNTGNNPKVRDHRKQK